MCRGTLHAPQLCKFFLVVLHSWVDGCFSAVGVRGVRVHTRKQTCVEQGWNKMLLLTR